MAAIDFPASPTSGQLFQAANGVTYQWNGTLWLVMAGPGGGTGDVSAQPGFAAQVLTTPQVITFQTAPVVVGNAGNWLNLTTGRYTPPAGKYYLSCSMSTAAPSGGNGTWTMSLRKNGTPLNSIQGSGSASFQIPLTIGQEVDANGTDFFDFTSSQQSSLMNSAANAVFTAFPLTGMQGPSGGPLGTVTGDFWAYNSAVLSVPTASITQIIPNTVGTGNSGGYYNATTGRWTPPAGRYFLYATVVAGLSTGAILFTATLRKNGVNITGATSTETPSNTSYYNTAKVNALVDANGSDYFDVAYLGNNINSSISAVNFGAFPITGLAGPPGPAGPANPTNVLRNFFSGYVSTAPGTQSMTWGAGQAADSLNAAWITMASSMTKSIANVWVAGTGNGGRGTGVALTANTWYYPFAIINGGNADIYFDTSVTGANSPAGTTAKRRLRPVKTDGSSNIIAHTGLGDYVQWTVPVIDITGQIQGTTSTNVAVIASVPPMAVKWRGRVQSNNSGTGQVHAVFVYTPGKVGSIAVNWGGTGGVATTVGVAATWAEVMTDSLGRLAAWTTVTGYAVTIWIETEGFVDDCGRFD